MTPSPQQAPAFPASEPADADIILAATYSQAKNWNMTRRNTRTQGAFGAVAQTFPAWIESLWELYGNGRRFIDEQNRAVLAEKTLRERKLTHLAYTPNLSGTLAECARKGSGLPAFEAALVAAVGGARVADGEGEGTASPVAGEAATATASPVAVAAATATASPVAGATAAATAPTHAALTAAETELLQLIARYRELAAEADLIEWGNALTYLAEHATDIFPAPTTVWCLGSTPLSAQAQLFLERIPALQVRWPDATPPAHLEAIPQERLRFAFSAGRYAQPLLVLRAIEELQSEHPGQPIAVCAKDPLALYRSLAPALHQRGITAAVRALKPFLDTDFGQVYTAIRRIHNAAIPWDRDALSDLLHSSYLHLNKADVWTWDKRLRNDRLADCAAILDELRGRKPMRLSGTAKAFCQVEDLVMQKLPELTAPCKQRYRNQAATDPHAADPAENAAAIDAFASLTYAQARLGALDPDLRQNLLTRLRLGVARSTAEPHAGVKPQVTFLSQKQASELAPGSVAGLIACDLTSDDYPLSDKQNATALLLGKLGIDAAVESPLARERRRFAALTRVPAHRLVLERALNDAAADPLYPCAMWEEFVDAYRDRAHLTSGDDLDDTYRLPPHLREQRMDAGEDDPFQDVRPGLDEAALAPVPQPQPARGNAAPHAADMAFPQPAQNPAHDLPRLSASQLDAFLECPYHWFAERRLATDGLDETLDPLHRGEFLHRVFQEFYERFGKKITEENLEDARALMFAEPDGVFARVRDAQANQRPGTRFVAIPGTTEEREVDALRDAADQWLRFETTFLPGFTPVAFEYPITDFAYAGCTISGRIDRIDADPQGNVVIIDYKGSMKPAFAPLVSTGRGKDATLALNGAAKVQGLIYTAALEAAGALDLGEVNLPIRRVAGALYVSYGKGNPVMGAYRADALGNLTDLPTLATPKQCALGATGPLSMDAVQAYAEQRVAGAVARMRAGEVAPNPVSAAPCQYCPIATCERKQA